MRATHTLGPNFEHAYLTTAGSSLSETVVLDGKRHWRSRNRRGVECDRKPGVAQPNKSSDLPVVSPREF